MTAQPDRLASARHTGSTMSMLPVLKPPPWKYRMPGRSPSPSGMKIRTGMSASGPGTTVSTTEATSSAGIMKLRPTVSMYCRPSSRPSVSNGGSPIDSTPVMNVCTCGCSGMPLFSPVVMCAGDRSGLAG